MITVALGDVKYLHTSKALISFLPAHIVNLIQANIEVAELIFCERLIALSTGSHIVRDDLFAKFDAGSISLDIIVSLYTAPFAMKPSTLMKCEMSTCGQEPARSCHELSGTVLQRLKKDSLGRGYRRS
jgi:hypothetical protein